MARVAGADGCKAGWICISRDLTSGALGVDVFPTARALIRQTPPPEILAVDVPIGLPESGARLCDVRAREKLGAARRASVFPAPVRGALAARSHAEASALTRKLDGRGVSAQAWGIFSKIRDVDRLLAGNPALQERVREAHPELCFWAWNGGVAMRSPKTSAPGRRERRRLVDCHFGDAFDWIRARYCVRDVAHDDILDALAVLWSAQRIERGDAETLPADPRATPQG